MHTTTMHVCSIVKYAGFAHLFYRSTFKLCRFFLLKHMPQYAIDKYKWARAALTFAGAGTENYETSARKLGMGAAGEVSLVNIAKKCGNDDGKWKHARDSRISCQEKRWTSPTAL